MLYIYNKLHKVCFKYIPCNIYIYTKRKQFSINYMIYDIVYTIYILCVIKYIHMDTNNV